MVGVNVGVSVGVSVGGQVDGRRYASTGRTGGIEGAGSSRGGHGGWQKSRFGGVGGCVVDGQRGQGLGGESGGLASKRARATRSLAAGLSTGTIYHDTRSRLDASTAVSSVLRTVWPCHGCLCRGRRVR